MDTTSNRPGGTIDVGKLTAPNIDLKKNISGENHDFIDKGTVFFLLKSMADELNGDKDAPELGSCLLGMTNELIQVLEDHESIHITPTNIDETGSVTETPLFPPKIPPLPPLNALRQLSREDQVRFLDKRASDLMREIEGLRLGYYQAPDYRQGYRMIEQARRRFRKLRDTAMKLGHWTDGCWNAGSEETYLV